MNKREQKVLIDTICENSDWRHVFSFANGTEGSPSVCEGGGRCSRKDFDAEDVTKVLAYDEGENDGPAWIIIVELRDSRFAFITAGCDFTGWECQSSGSAWVSNSLENLWKFGCTGEARGRFLEDGITDRSVLAMAKK